MIKKISKLFKNLPFTIASLALLSTLGFGAVATASSTTTTGSQTSSSTISQDKVVAIIVKGDAEIARRLNSLNNLGSLITASTKLTTADKASLTGEVNREISGLHSDKTTLGAAVTLAEAHSAAQSIFTEYRVYALVVPQVYLIRAADRQQLIEAKLTGLASAITSSLGSSINSAQTAQLSQLKSEITSASDISSSTEASVLALTPAEYNTNHSLLLQYYAQLNTAKLDISQAITFAKTLIGSIK